MARKCKVGIEYFSHDVDMAQDKKIKIIKAKHGLIGYALFLRLLEEIYREEGYFVKIDEDFNILFSDDNNLDYNVYILMLNDYINKGLFDKEMYDKYNILTSKRIQENYIAATDRRKEVEFIEEYLLVDVSSMYSEKVNVIINCLNVDINPLNDIKSTQSKVNKKESKEKEKKNIYTTVYSYYLSKDLIKHKALTDGMKKAIDKVMKDDYKLDTEYILKIIDRHEEKVKETKNDKFQVKKRSLHELFGQKKFDGKGMIYEDYLDEVWEQRDISNNTVKKVDFDDGKPKVPEAFKDWD